MLRPGSGQIPRVKNLTKERVKLDHRDVLFLVWSMYELREAENNGRCSCLRDWWGWHKIKKQKFDVSSLDFHSLELIWTEHLTVQSNASNSPRTLLWVVSFKMKSVCRFRQPGWLPMTWDAAMTSSPRTVTTSSYFFFFFKSQLSARTRDRW